MPRILLTGAGFTKNFGAPLAEEVWCNIFNHKALKSQNNLKKLMLSQNDDFNFEEIYTEVLTNDKYGSTEKVAMIDALKGTYEDMDNAISLDIALSNNYGVDYNHLISFIESFSIRQGGSGYIFTLNQDLFLERLFINHYKKPAIISPFVETPLWDYQVGKHIESKVFRFDEKKFEEFKNISNLTTMAQKYPLYVKLHGSYKWVNSKDSTEYPLILTGKDKSRDLGHPLISNYLEIFQSVLSQKNSKLLVIGYSFRNPHINEIILSAIENYDLKLYIINPELPAQFINRVRKNVARPGKLLNGECLNKSIEGYYPVDLEQIFPLQKTPFETKYKHQLRSNFFDG